MRRYPLTLWFLGAYLLFNDGVQTVIGCRPVRDRGARAVPDDAAHRRILLVQVVAFFGALALGRIAGRYGAKRTVLGALVAWTGVLVAAYFLAGGRGRRSSTRWPRSSGFVLGGTQALSRSLFSQLIPPGKEAEYFGFYEISDRGTSWLGPAPVRADLPAHRLLPVRDLQPGVLLRRPGSSRWPRCTCGGRSSRPATPRRSACDRARTRRAPVPLPVPAVRPGLRRPAAAPGAGAPARSSTARWTAGSPRWRCRSTTTRAGRAGTGCW